MGSKASGNRSGKSRAPGAGRPNEEARIEKRFGVRPPLPILFDAIEERYGLAIATELKSLYADAQRRAERAHRLLGFEGDVKRGPSLMMSEEKLERRRRCLDNPQAYIDGEIDLVGE